MYARREGRVQTLGQPLGDDALRRDDVDVRRVRLQGLVLPDTVRTLAC